MTAKMPESVLDLFERPLLCALTTVSAKGQPHAVPVWCDFDGTYVRVNAPVSTLKVKNMEQNSKVAVLIIDPEQAWHWVEVRGHVAETRDETNGAREHINALSQKYTGNPVYQDRAGVSVERAMFLIEPDKIHGR